MRNRLPMLLCSVAVGIVFAGYALTLLAGEAKARPTVKVVNDYSAEAFPTVSELTVFFNEMRRETKDSVDPKVTKMRISRVKKLAAEGELHNSADYFVAATVMVAGTTPDDALLAHDLALTALAMGDTRAKSFVAIGEDQFLVRINRPQRFGTQNKASGGSQVIGEVDPGVTDGMRHALGLPSKRMLAEGKGSHQTVVQGFKKMMPTKTIQLPDAR